MQIRTAAPNGILAAFLLAFLATAGLFYVNIMQAIVSGLADGLHISSSQAGRIGAANTYGAALGAFAGVFLVPRLSWRVSAWILLLVLIGIDLSCVQLRSVSVLVVVRFCHGGVGGLLVATAYSVMARTSDADRAFGVLLIVQYGLGGLGNMVLPGLVPRFGVGILFLALAAFSLASLAMLPFLDSYPVPQRTGTSSADLPARRRVFVLSMALAALFLFQAANMGLGSYAIGLGRAAGLGLNFSSAIVGAASWMGVAGAAAVAALSTRFGRTVPLLIALALTLLATWLFHFSAHGWVYVIANFVSSAIWAFVVPYLFGLCAQLDHRGYTAVLAGFASKMGLASGIAAGAYVLAARDNYPALIDLAMVGLLVSGVAATAAALLTDSRGRTGERAARAGVA
jgi:DHA1 family inner membrane transport protein